MAEHAVETVQITLVLNQRRTRKKIEVVDVKKSDTSLHCLHPGQVFAQRDWYFGFTQFGKERKEHQSPQIESAEHQISNKIREGSSTQSLMRTKKLTASRP